MSEPNGQKEAQLVTAHPGSPLTSRAPVCAAIKPQYVQERNATGRLLHTSIIHSFTQQLQTLDPQEIFFK